MIKFQFKFLLLVILYLHSCGKINQNPDASLQYSRYGYYNTKDSYAVYIDRYIRVLDFKKFEGYYRQGFNSKYQFIEGEIDGKLEMRLKNIFSNPIIINAKDNNYIDHSLSYFISDTSILGSYTVLFNESQIAPAINEQIRIIDTLFKIGGTTKKGIDTTLIQRIISQTDTSKVFPKKISPNVILKD